MIERTSAKHSDVVVVAALLRRERRQRHIGRQRLQHIHVQKLAHNINVTYIVIKNMMMMSWYLFDGHELARHGLHALLRHNAAQAGRHRRNLKHPTTAHK
jgi:hypothetical protein